MGINQLNNSSVNIVHMQLMQDPTCMSIGVVYILKPGGLMSRIQVDMAIRVVEFLNGGCKIRKIFA